MSEKREDATRNQLKELFLNALGYYIYHTWEGAKGVKIDEKKTFTDVIDPTFYEKEEGNVSPERAHTPHTYGVLWSAEDIELDVMADLSDDGEVSVFSKTYVNDTDAPIQVSEKMEQGISVTDACEIGFTEKINAGYEQSISIGINLMGVEASTQSKFSMGVELGSSQTTTKTVQETTTSGFSIDMEIPPKSARTVNIVAMKKSCNVLQSATFIPKGKAYAQVAYGAEDVEKAHTYVFDLHAIADYFDELHKNDKNGEEAEKAPYFKFPVQYMLQASAHRDFHVQISSGNEVLTTYPLKK